MARLALHWGHYDPTESRNGFSASLSRGLARLLGVFTDWNPNPRDQEIERFVERSGGRLTDALEREIANRAITGGFGH